MPYKIECTQDHLGVVTTYWGVVTDKDIVRSCEEKMARKADFQVFQYAITDLSRVDRYNITPTALKQNARITSEIFKENKALLVALVLPTQLEYGMGRVWQAHADSSGERSRIFKNRSEAERWIKMKLERPATSE